MSFLVVSIFINIPCWDFQCSAKECSNITHSLIGLYLAGNICIQCPPRECANITHFLIGLYSAGNSIIKYSMSSYGVCKYGVSVIKVDRVVRVVRESRISRSPNSLQRFWNNSTIKPWMKGQTCLRFY